MNSPLPFQTVPPPSLGQKLVLVGTGLAPSALIAPWTSAGTTGQL